VVLVLKVPLLVLSLAMALVFSAQPLAAVNATDRWSRLDPIVTIHIFDTTSRTRFGRAYETLLWSLQQQRYCRGDCYNIDWIDVRVGQVARFKVTNKGKKPHSFQVFGRKIKMLRPGATATFTVPLLKRGSFPFVIDDGTKGFKGIFLVN
jgi:hypothetical protein